MKIVYEPVSIKIKELDKVQEIIDNIPSPKALVTTIQYLDSAQSIENCEVIGQLLGCNVSVLNNFRGENIIYLGTGRFHPLIVKYYYLNKRVYALNPENFKKKEITEKDVKPFLTRINIAREALKNAEKVGIIVSVKPGQYFLKKALDLKKKFEKEDKKAYIFIFDNINPEEFLNHELDVLINTACPRIGLDDYISFNTPIINYKFIQ